MEFLYIFAYVMALFIVLITTVVFSPRSLQRSLVVLAMRFTVPTPAKDMPWKLKVLPHGPLEVVASNVWTVEGSLPPNGPRLKRKMVIHRPIGTTALWIHSPVCVNEETLAQIKGKIIFFFYFNTLGKVQWIVVPNFSHRLDAFAWSQEFPDAQIVCPRGSLTGIKSAVDIAKSCEEVFTAFSMDNDFKNTSEVQYIAPKGFYSDDANPMELGYLLKHSITQGRASAYSLVFCDAYFNLDPKSSDVDPALVTLGSVCGFSCTTIGRFLMVKNKRRAREWAEIELAAIAEGLNVVHISVAHGVDLVSRNCDEIVGAIRNSARSFEEPLSL
ncbi:hypothetical protein HK100_006265 [Physocladia obscura]|uniref:Uncharacterized protein n=1 Tax=Physocladia obscura TaxID=109957 RepID=A0AAD5T6B9_9FUNG|nr:hypothetical protein HK100_006265 [Physocladia obscura]